MKVDFVKTKLGNMIDMFGGANLSDVNQTINAGLDQREEAIYARAIGKVAEGITLNREDLKVLDKIDALTFESHHMCLKDSVVTKARIKVSKKYGMEFIDRDGLVEHMNLVLGMRTQANAKGE